MSGIVPEPAIKFDKNFAPFPAYANDILIFNQFKNIGLIMTKKRVAIRNKKVIQTTHFLRLCKKEAKRKKIFQMIIIPNHIIFTKCEKTVWKSSQYQEHTNANP